MSGIRVAMLAPPWLPIPPNGYGGIENVLLGLIPELLKLGVEVEVFTTGDSKIKGVKVHSLYKEGQYNHIHKPQYISLPVSVAHILHALNHIREDGKFDIIHDHNGFLGPLALSYTDKFLPPAVHTLHGPPFSSPDRIDPTHPNNMPMWEQASHTKKIFYVGISEAMMRTAPKAMKRQSLPVVHNALDVDLFPFVEKKQDYFITLARFHPEKGQHIAVNISLDLDVPLKMAGVVGDIADPRKVLMELANPLSLYRSLADFRYYSDFIFPYLEAGHIEYVGEVAGQRKLDFISNAKALLFPIQWDEPFGMAVIEAMACGTPVVAMARGAMPEIIEHGVNGFLANNEKEFTKYVQRVSEIDPQACRESVERKFSARVMAKNYLKRYKTVLSNYQK